MKSFLFNPNFSWPTVLSSVAWTLPIDVIMEIIFLGGYFKMKKVLMVVNGLISKAEMKILKRAASILKQSDKHDQYFYDQLVEVGCPQDVGNSYQLVQIGDGFLLLHERLVKRTAPVIIKPSEMED